MSTWHNSLDINKTYRRVWDFGCSMTYYRWLTWTDFIALTVNADKFVKNSWPGAGTKHVYHQLRHVCANYEFTDQDLVLIALPSMTRKDVLNDYRNCGSMAWSSKGDFNFMDTKNLKTSPEYGYFGDFRANIGDVFLDAYSHCEMLIDLFKRLPCDKVIVDTDPFRWKILERMGKIFDVEADPVFQYLSHMNYYVNDLSENHKKSLVKNLEAMSSDYARLQLDISTMFNYDLHTVRLQAEKLCQDNPEFPELLDPHPNPDEAFKFVRDYVCNGEVPDKMTELHREADDNWCEVMRYVFSQPDPSGTLYGDHIPNCMENNQSDIPVFYDINWQFAQQGKNMGTGSSWPEYSFEEYLYE